MAAKVALKNAGMAGLENLVQSLLPEMMQKLASFERSISAVRDDLSGMNDRFAALEKKLTRVPTNSNA